MGFFVYRSWEQKLNEWGQEKDLREVYSSVGMKTGLTRWMEGRPRQKSESGQCSANVGHHWGRKEEEV